MNEEEEEINSPEPEKKKFVPKGNPAWKKGVFVPRPPKKKIQRIKHTEWEKWIVDEEQAKKDWPSLTEHQKKFVDEFIKNGGNKTFAAEQAGYEPKCAYDRASQLLANSKVVNIILYKRKLYNDTIGLPIENIIKRMIEIEQKAFDEGKYKDAIAANVEIARLRKFYDKEEKDYSQLISGKIKINLGGGRKIYDMDEPISKDDIKKMREEEKENNDNKEKE